MPSHGTLRTRRTAGHGHVSTPRACADNALRGLRLRRADPRAERTAGAFRSVPSRSSCWLFCWTSGVVVSRDDLQRALWGGETFVDFEQGVNHAIRELRAALGDSAESPRFIQTLPRRGYRFIAPCSRSFLPRIAVASPPPRRLRKRRPVGRACLPLSPRANSALRRRRSGPLRCRRLHGFADWRRPGPYPAPALVVRPFWLLRTRLSELASRMRSRQGLVDSRPYRCVRMPQDWRGDTEESG